MMETTTLIPQICHHSQLPKARLGLLPQTLSRITLLILHILQQRTRLFLQEQGLMKQNLIPTRYRCCALSVPRRHRSPNPGGSSRCHLRVHSVSPSQLLTLGTRTDDKKGVSYALYTLLSRRGRTGDLDRNPWCDHVYSFDNFNHSSSAGVRDLQ